MSGQFWKGFLFPAAILLISIYASRGMLRRTVAGRRERTGPPAAGALEHAACGSRAVIRRIRVRLSGFAVLLRKRLVSIDRDTPRAVARRGGEVIRGARERLSQLDVASFATALRIRGGRVRRAARLAGGGQSSSVIARRVRMAQDAVRTLSRPEMAALHRGPARGTFFRPGGLSIAGRAQPAARGHGGSSATGRDWRA
jgi:hypothetical protein